MEKIESDLHVDTPEAIQFLAGRLSEVIATRRYNRGRWSIRRVARYIKDSTDIDGTVSDTTLGRFLNPNDLQRPTHDTIRLVADFLLLMNYMSEKELEHFAEPPSLRAGLSLAQFFEVPDSKPVQTLMRSLAGHFIHQREIAPFVLTARLVLQFQKETGLLLVTETLTVSMRQGILTTTTHEPLRVYGRFASTGQALASLNLIGMFLKGDRFDSVLTTDAVFYDGDNVCDLVCQRNSGWTALDSGEVHLGERITPTSKSHLVAKVLANNPRFSRKAMGEKFDKRIDSAVISTPEQRSFADTRTMRGDVADAHIEKLYNEAKSDAQKLTVALEHGARDLFRQALIDGADPNVVLDGTGEPLITHLAKNANIEFIHALLESGRCKFPKDEKGLTPSSHVAILLRRVVGVPGAEDLAANFKALYSTLRSAENAAATGPEITPDL